MITSKRYVSLDKIPKLYGDAFKVNTMRQWIMRKKPGFIDTIRRIEGGKTLVDLDIFEQWIDGQTVD